MNPQQLIAKIRLLLENTLLKYNSVRKVFEHTDNDNNWIEFKLTGLREGYIAVIYGRDNWRTCIWINPNEIELDGNFCHSYEELLRKYKHYDFIKVLEEHSIHL